jgi:hypothetical protein
MYRATTSKVCATVCIASGSDWAKVGIRDGPAHGRQNSGEALAAHQAQVPAVGHGRQSPQSRVSNGPPIRLRFKSSSLAITVVGWGRQGWRQPSAPPAYLAKTQEGSGQTTVRVIHAKTREEAWIPLFDDGEAIFLELASSPAAFA